MKPLFRLLLYSALIVVGLVAIILKREDQFGLVLGIMGIGVGIVAVYWWLHHKPETTPCKDTSPEENTHPKSS